MDCHASAAATAPSLSVCSSPSLSSLIFSPVPPSPPFPFTMSFRRRQWMMNKGRLCLARFQVRGAGSPPGRAGRNLHFRHGRVPFHRPELRRRAHRGVPRGRFIAKRERGRLFQAQRLRRRAPFSPAPMACAFSSSSRTRKGSVMLRRALTACSAASCVCFRSLTS